VSPRRVLGLSLAPALLATGCALAPTAANPVLGMWTWQDHARTCREVHFYKPDGDAATWSAREVLRKRYVITPVEPGLWRVETEVITTNGEADCLGRTTPVGARSTWYVRPLNGGGHLSCASREGTSCFGSAVPRERL
jgi:hypothetical protein